MHHFGEHKNETNHLLIGVLVLGMLQEWAEPRYARLIRGTGFRLKGKRDLMLDNCKLLIRKSHIEDYRFYDYDGDDNIKANSTACPTPDEGKNGVSIWQSCRPEARDFTGVCCSVFTLHPRRLVVSLGNGCNQQGRNLLASG